MIFFQTVNRSFHQPEAFDHMMLHGHLVTNDVFFISLKYFSDASYIFFLHVNLCV